MILLKVLQEKDPNPVFTRRIYSHPDSVPQINSWVTITLVSETGGKTTRCWVKDVEWVYEDTQKHEGGIFSTRLKHIEVTCIICT